MKARKSGREKAGYEMKAFFVRPKGKTFVYRSDDTMKRLMENDKIKPKGELHALQIKWAAIRTLCRQVTIYDNTEGFPGEMIFQEKNGVITVNRIENWD